MASSSIDPGNLNTNWQRLTTSATTLPFSGYNTQALITFTLKEGKLIGKINGNELEVDKDNTDAALYRTMRQQALMTRLEEAKIANNNRFMKEAMEALLEFADIPEATRLIHG